MKSKIMILSALDYEKDNQQRSCIKFIFIDKEKFENTQNYVGYNVCTQYYKGFVKNLIPVEYVCVPLTANFQIRSSYKDPLRSYNTIESIEKDGKVINLFQTK